MRCFYCHQLGNIIALKGKDPRVMGHRSPSHLWDMHRHSWVLLIPIWARGIGISLRVLYKHLLLYRHAREARAWVEVEIEDMAYRLGLQGPRGVSTPLHHMLRLQISQ